MAGGRGASAPAALRVLLALLAASRPAVAGRAARGAPPWREAPPATGPGGRKAPAPGEGGGKGAARRRLTGRPLARWGEAPRARVSGCRAQVVLARELKRAFRRWPPRKGAARCPGPAEGGGAGGAVGPVFGPAAPAGEARQQPQPQPQPLGVGREPPGCAVERERGGWRAARRAGALPLGAALPTAAWQVLGAAGVL